jgi:ADP-ribose pyrophosphatase
MIQFWTVVKEVTNFNRFSKHIKTVTFHNPNNGDNPEFVQFGQPHWIEILVLTEDGKIKMVRQYKQGCRYVNREMPAGTLAGVEYPITAAARYLLKETGCEAEELIPLHSEEQTPEGTEPLTRRWWWMTTRNSTTRFYGFVAKGCRKVAEPHHNPDEPMECITMDLREFIEFMQHRSENAAQAAVTFAALPHLGITLNFPQ